jgi:hypothetical protein
MVTPPGSWRERRSVPTGTGGDRPFLEHPERNEERMGDLLFIGLLVVVFIVSVLFVPLLKRD